MFTGIIEEIGIVTAVRRGAVSSALTIAGGVIFDDLKLGDSVAVNGVCLTAASLASRAFTADVMHETLRRSTLGALQGGSRVNLERAMPANGRFGGHIVSGHIDGTGRVAAVRRDGNALWYTIAAEQAVLRLIVEKGSVAIDGVSLTVAAVGKADFSVSVIPHTAGATVLGERRAGDAVNLENDMIGKYVERLLDAPKGGMDSGITAAFLAAHGY